MSDPFDLTDLSRPELDREIERLSRLLITGGVPHMKDYGRGLIFPDTRYGLPVVDPAFETRDEPVYACSVCMDGRLAGCPVCCPVESEERWAA